MRNKDYNTKDIIRYLTMMIGLFTAMKFTNGAAFVIFAPLLFSAVAKKKTEDIAFWVMVGVSSLSINGYFVPKGSLYGWVHRFTFMLFGLIGMMQLAGQRKNAVVGCLLGMLVYTIYMFLPSTTGWWPMISFLKLILFSTVYMALISMANTAISARKFNVARLRSAFLAVAIYIVLGSVLLIPFPAISSMTPEELLGSTNVVSLYKGMTNHSQWLGPLAAAFGIMIFGDLLLSIQRWDKLYTVLLICCPVLVFKSASRTAMGTFLIGMAFIFYRFIKARKVKSVWRARAFSAVSCAIALGGLLLLALPSGRDSVARFILKYNTEASMAEVNMEDTIVTRKGLVDRQMENFKASPAFGNGFQVSEEMQYMSEHSSGMMLSAPIEKGVWISAILEEGGVIGLLIYGTFFITALVMMISKHYYISATIFLSVHVSNLGEFSMFSMSGCGGQWWMLVFIALIFDAWRIKGNNAPTGYSYTVATRRPIGYNPAWR